MPKPCGQRRCRYSREDDAGTRYKIINTSCQSLSSANALPKHPHDQMAQCLLLFCLILAHVFTPTLARILSDAHTFVQPRVERRDGPASDPPTSNGLAGEVGLDPPTSNEFAGEVGSDPPTSSNELAGKDEETAREPAESPESERLENDHRHHHQDGSVACGGAIVGGLATAAFAVVFCYIRVTRRRNAQVAV